MTGSKRRDPGSKNVPGIKMTREVRLAIDWKEATTHLIEVVAHGFLTYFGGDGVAHGLSALVGTASSLKVESEPGEKAWSLAVLCFAWALDELKSLPGIGETQLRAAVHDVIGDARSVVDGGGEVVPITFIERPTTLPVYRALRDAIVRRKDTFRFGAHESDDALRFRFDAAYDRAMFEVFARRVDVYQSLIALLSSPAAAASEKQMNWAAYRSRLIFEFEVRPIFGQETTRLSLSQLYVPLRCYWPKAETATPDRKPRFVLASQTHDIGMLDRELDRWLDLTNEDDYLRLIGGGPGSGKSTSLRAFACRMARRLDWWPLYIPLQHVDLEGDLRASVNRYFTDRTSGSFTQPPLTRQAIEDGPPLLLIFDGLDELARPGEAANDIVNLFITKLTNLVSSLRGDGSKIIKVVVSGRMPSFQAAKRYISPPKHGCLEIYGFAPEADNPYRDTEKTDNLWKMDQRPIWWGQYASLTGVLAEVPPAFSHEKLHSVTHEPLLCYLLVLSGYALANWEKAAENPNRMYRTLVDSIWERGWGENIGPLKRQGAGKTLSKRDFNTLMQTIALAAWKGGDTRVASEQGFLNAVKDARAEDAWENFRRDNGSDVTNLAMNFGSSVICVGDRRTLERRKHA